MVVVELSGTDGNVRLCSLLDVATARYQSRRGKRLMEVTSHWCWTNLESSATTLTGPARSRTTRRGSKCDVCKKRFLHKRTLKMEINTLFNLMDNDH